MIMWDIVHLNVRESRKGYRQYITAEYKYTLAPSLILEHDMPVSQESDRQVNLFVKRNFTFHSGGFFFHARERWGIGAYRFVLGFAWNVGIVPCSTNVRASVNEQAVWKGKGSDIRCWRLEAHASGLSMSHVWGYGVHKMSKYSVAVISTAIV